MMPLAAMLVPDELDALWPRFEPLVRLGLKYGVGRFTAEDVKASIADGRRQLWATVPDGDCILVTQIDQYPQAKVGHIFLCAGRLPKAWREILFHVTEWLKAEGCRAVELNGRRGWARKLRDFHVPMILLRKEL